MEKVLQLLLAEFVGKDLAELVAPTLAQVSLLAFVFGGLALLFKLIFRALDNLLQLGDKEAGHKNRSVVARQLKGFRVQWLRRYRANLDRLQTSLSALYGDAGRLKALGVSINIALAYPLLSFLVGYVRGGPADLFGSPLLPADHSRRWLWLLGLCTFGAVEWALIRNHKRIDAASKRWIQAGRYPWLRRVGLALAIGAIPAVIAALTEDRFVAVAVAFAFAFAGAFAGAVAFTVAFTVAFAVAVSGAGAVAIAVAFAIAGAFPVAGAFVGAVAVAGAGATDITVLNILLVLPWINGLHDWVSWRASRYFIKKARRARHWYSLLLELSLDTAVAVALLLSMVVLVPSAVEAMTLMPLKEELHIHWRELAETACADPWGKGFMVTSMLITTLIPTALHVICAVLGLSMRWIPGKGLMTDLERLNDSTKPGHGNTIAPKIITARLTISVLLTLLPFLAVVAWVVYPPQLGVGPFLFEFAKAHADPRWLGLLPVLFLLGWAPASDWLLKLIGGKQVAQAESTADAARTAPTTPDT